jgi:hypothetical protein
MRTRQWIARDPEWDAEPPDGVRLVGVDRLPSSGMDLPDVVIRRVRTEVEQYRELIANYGSNPSTNPPGRGAAPDNA